MNLDVMEQGFKILDKYWENQWLIGELEELAGQSSGSSTN